MGERKITIRDVAAEAGVSIASVSLYLNGKPGLSDATRERIEGAIQQMRYTPLRRKPEERSTTVSLIGLLVEKLPVSTFSDMFYGEVIQGLEWQARSLGYSIVLMVVDPATDLLEMIANHADMEGLVVLGGGDITPEAIQQLSDQELPVVLVDNQFPDTDLDCVVADNFSGSYQAVHYLIGQGYKRIAFIQGPAKYRSLIDRFRGYCCALIEHGLELNFELIQESVSKGLPNKGYREMKALLEREASFDAVFCVSDRSAFGATHFVDPLAAEDLIRSETGGLGADYVFESAGRQQTMELAYRLARRGGTVVFVGIAESTSLVSLPATQLTRSEKHILGSFYGGAKPSRDFPAILELYRRGKAKLDELIGARYTLDDINEAVAAMRTGRYARVVIEL